MNPPGPSHTWADCIVFSPLSFIRGKKFNKKSISVILKKDRLRGFILDTDMGIRAS